MIVKTYDQYASHIGKWADEEYIALDYETTGMPYANGSELLGVSLSGNGHQGIYICFRALDYVMPDDDAKKIRADLKRLFGNSFHKLIVHNSMFELPFTLREFGIQIPLERIVDTICYFKAEHLGELNSFSLKPLARKFLSAPEWDKDLNDFMAMIGDSGGGILHLMRSKTFGRLEGRDLFEFWENKTQKDEGRKIEKEIFKRIDSLVKFLADRGYGKEVAKEIVGRLQKLQDNEDSLFGLVPAEMMAKYSVSDVLFTFKLWEYVKTKRDQDTYTDKAYRNILMQYYLGFEMEKNGIGWDKRYSDKVKKYFVDLLKDSYFKMISIPVFYDFWVRDKKKGDSKTQMSFIDTVREEYLSWCVKLKSDFNNWDEFFNVASSDATKDLLKYVLGLEKMSKRILMKKDKDSDEMKETADESVVNEIWTVLCAKYQVKTDVIMFEDVVRLEPVLQLFVYLKLCKKLLKMLSTYFKSYENSIRETDWNEVFPKRTNIDFSLRESDKLLLGFNYLVCNARTGRWTSPNPSLHTLPDSSNIRSFLRSRFNGGVIVGADYSQIEVRVLAALSGEERMMKVFEDESVDFHRKSAQAIYGVEDPTPQQRRAAKGGTFALLYGKSVDNFAKDFFEGDKKKAEEFFSQFYDAFPKVRTWITNQHETVVQGGVPVRSLFGRKIWVDASVLGLGKARRLSVNYPIQGCFTLQQRVKLLDGTFPTFDELIDLYKDTPTKTFDVYSYDFINRKIVVGKAYNPRIVKYVSDVLELILDNGEKVRCTPNHRFFSVSGGEIEARDLKKGTSLLPLYWKLNEDGYEEVFDGKWVPTHRMVKPSVPSGYIRHHRDFNKLNNSSRNLEVLPWKDHFKRRHHTCTNRKRLLDHKYNTWVQERKNLGWKKFMSDPDKKILWRAKISASIKKNKKFLSFLSKTMKRKNMIRHILYPKWSKNQKDSVRREVFKRLRRTKNVLGMNHEFFKEALRLSWVRTKKYRRTRLSQGHNKKESIVRHRLASIRREKDPRYRIHRCLPIFRSMTSQGLSYITRRDYDRSLQIVRGVSKKIWRYSDYLEGDWRGVLKKVRMELYKNHRVISIRKIHLKKPIPVADISVKKFQNFALASGIFAHNSASDIASVSGYMLYKYIQKKGLKSKLFSFVHDALYIDVPPNELFLINDFATYMCSVADELAGVKNRVDPEIGVGLGDKLKIKKLDKVNRILVLNGKTEYLKRLVDELKSVCDVNEKILEESTVKSSISELFQDKGTVSTNTGKSYSVKTVELSVGEIRGRS